MTRPLHLALTALLFGCGAYYAGPEGDAPKCEAIGATIEAEPGSGACVFGQLYAAGFDREFRGFPGVDVDRVRGAVVRTAAGSDGGAFYSAYWGTDVGGQTDCTHHVADLARIPNHMVHEFVHLGEDCACRSYMPEGVSADPNDCHIGWDERGVYAAIWRAERL